MSEKTAIIQVESAEAGLIPSRAQPRHSTPPKIARFAALAAVLLGALMGALAGYGLGRLIGNPISSQQLAFKSGLSKEQAEGLLNGSIAPNDIEQQSDLNVEQIQELLVKTTKWSAVGMIAGTAVGAIGIGLIIYLALQAMIEWKTTKDPEQTSVGQQTKNDKTFQ
jgi:membrane protein YqaA with SNARE-associated domain